jgi:hypothetical protein
MPLQQVAPDSIASELAIFDSSVISALWRALIYFYGKQQGSKFFLLWKSAASERRPPQAKVAIIFGWYIRKPHLRDGATIHRSGSLMMWGRCRATKNIALKLWNRAAAVTPNVTLEEFLEGAKELKPLILLVPLPRLERGTPRSTICLDKHKRLFSKSNCFTSVS